MPPERDLLFFELLLSYAAVVGEAAASFVGEAVAYGDGGSVRLLCESGSSLWCRW